MEMFFLFILLSQMWKWNHLQAAKGFTYWQGWETCGILCFSMCSWGLCLLVLTLVWWISSLVGKQFCLFWSSSRGSAWSSVVILFPSLWKKRENWGSISIFLPPRQEVYPKAFGTKRTSRNGQTPRSLAQKLHWPPGLRTSPNAAPPLGKM